MANLQGLRCAPPLAIFGDPFGVGCIGCGTFARWSRGRLRLPRHRRAACAVLTVSLPIRARSDSPVSCSPVPCLLFPIPLPPASRPLSPLLSLRPPVSSLRTDVRRPFRFGIALHILRQLAEQVGDVDLVVVRPLALEMVAVVIGVAFQPADRIRAVVARSLPVWQRRFVGMLDVADVTLMAEVAFAVRGQRLGWCKLDVLVARQSIGTIGRGGKPVVVIFGLRREVVFLRLGRLAHREVGLGLRQFQLLLGQFEARVLRFEPRIGSIGAADDVGGALGDLGVGVAELVAEFEVGLASRFAGRFAIGMGEDAIEVRPGFAGQFDEMVAVVVERGGGLVPGISARAVLRGLGEESYFVGSEFDFGFHGAPRERRA